MKKLTIEDKLALDIYHTGEQNPHIDLDLDYKDDDEIHKLLMACPAGCYTLIDGLFGFSHLGCFECGTCRVLSHGKIVKDWRHPIGERGVSFRQG